MRTVTIALLAGCLTSASASIIDIFSRPGLSHTLSTASLTIPEDIGTNYARQVQTEFHQSVDLIITGGTGFGYIAFGAEVTAGELNFFPNDQGLFYSVVSLPVASPCGFCQPLVRFTYGEAFTLQVHSDSIISYTYSQMGSTNPPGWAGMTISTEATLTYMGVFDDQAGTFENTNAVISAAAASVPEPSTFLLTGLLLSGCLHWSRKTRYNARSGNRPDGQAPEER